MIGDTNSVVIRKGEVIATNGKLYTICQVCGSVVRVNKPLLGSLHICAEQPTAPR